MPNSHFFDELLPNVWLNFAHLRSNWPNSLDCWYLNQCWANVDKFWANVGKFWPTWIAVLWYPTLKILEKKKKKTKSDKASLNSVYQIDHYIFLYTKVPKQVKFKLVLAILTWTGQVNVRFSMKPGTVLIQDLQNNCQQISTCFIRWSIPESNEVSVNNLKAMQGWYPSSPRKHHSFG